MNQKHLYHLVDSSPWPIVGATGAFFTAMGFMFFMNSVDSGLFIFFLGLIIILKTMFWWWRDMLVESADCGNHTKVVCLGLKLGFFLFMISEMMLFIAFFWAFFHSSLSPSIFFGMAWPPSGMNVMSLEMPFLNTIMLVFSSMTLNASHKSLKKGDVTSSQAELIFTMFLGMYFEIFQMFEYITSPFDMTDGIVGSTFFMLTGLHGFHVLVGGMFLTMCLFRFFQGHFSQGHHLGFLFAIWYWHFVDIVWIFVFAVMYLWGFT